MNILIDEHGTPWSGDERRIRPVLWGAITIRVMLNGEWFALITSAWLHASGNAGGVTSTVGGGGDELDVAGLRVSDRLVAATGVTGTPRSERDLPKTATAGGVEFGTPFPPTGVARALPGAGSTSLP